jgi:hypothetical protein
MRFGLFIHRHHITGLPDRNFGAGDGNRIQAAGPSEAWKQAVWRDLASLTQAGRTMEVGSSCLA